MDLLLVDIRYFMVLFFAFGLLQLGGAATKKYEASESTWTVDRLSHSLCMLS
jgi:hypothetical protein